jgi:hypothetical protein
MTGKGDRNGVRVGKNGLFKRDAHRFEGKALEEVGAEGIRQGLNQTILPPGGGGPAQAGGGTVVHGAGEVVVQIGEGLPGPEADIGGKPLGNGTLHIGDTGPRHEPEVVEGDVVSFL